MVLMSGNLGPVRPLRLGDENLERLAAKAAFDLMHLVRVRQIFGLKPLNPDPLSVERDASERHICRQYLHT